MRMRMGGLMLRSERKLNSGWRPTAAADVAALVVEVGLPVVDRLVVAAMLWVPKGPK